MHIKATANRMLKGVTLLLVLALVASNPDILVRDAQAQPVNSFSYNFTVDENGSATTKITFRSSSGSGSSWVFVPKFTEWTNRTVKGKVTEWSLDETETLANVSHYFYQVLRFFFRSDDSGFEINVHFNVSTAAMIIEPNGIFFSPQIGIQQGNKLEASVAFPRVFTVDLRQATADGSSGSYRPSSTGSNSNYVLFNDIPRTENLLRIEIGFKTVNNTAELVKLSNGVFTFETSPRYSEHAKSILDLYSRTYHDLVELFNVTLQKAQVRFFLPEFGSLLSIGGYVPFVSERMGDIHINIMYTRSIEGYIETIAMHELVHQFLWKASISPRTMLWLHEGLAQYVSIEIVSRLGYEGAQMMRQEQWKAWAQLKQTQGENVGFLKFWNPSRQPQDIWVYYVAAYYVVSSLAEARGGLDYYARFFALLEDERIDDTATLAYYLSLAADESVVRKLNNWGFGIPDLYIYSPLLSNVEQAVDDVSPLYQPYKFVAELLYQQALLNAREESNARMQFYLTLAILVARLAPLLTLITVSGILFGAVLLVLRKAGVFSSY